MAVSETPIYPGKAKTQLTNIAGGAASSYTILTSDATYAQVVSDLALMTKTTTSRVGVRLEVTDGVTTTILGRLSATGTTQYTAYRLSNFISLLETDPFLRLKPGQSLQLTTENTEAGTLDCTVLAASYEYPN